MPIYYSLGNLTNPFSLEYMWRSGVARLVVAKGAQRTYVRSAELVEVEQVLDGETIRLRARERSR